MRHLNRILFGALVGLLAGVSFGITILPLVVERILPGISTEFYLLSANRALPASLLWAPGGAWIGYRGGGRRSALAFGLWGLAVGAAYGWFVSPGGSDPALIGLSAVTAALYAAGAGFLVGAAFPPREWEDARIAEARAARAAASDTAGTDSPASSMPLATPDEGA